ncbi:hypothetical protein GTS_28950 [Gandjariella thermophila]|uniref:Uncharacterized protein n=1 Tax=Gandjariella thermophila TaxID=1931992 RepID=A0A4D4J7T7_9PSEU|nr:hypothetical protein GTS_28950 [Gandjariella thermophila]
MPPRRHRFGSPSERNVDNQVVSARAWTAPTYFDLFDNSGLGTDILDRFVESDPRRRAHWSRHERRRAAS